MRRILRGLALGSNLSEVRLFRGGVDLSLALTETGPVLIGIFVYTLVALHTFDIVNTIFIGLRDRSAAGIALIKTALDQAVTYGDAVVEDEAFTLPSALFLRHLFEILQDSALEVIDFINPFTEQKVGRFFTPNAAGAKHGNLFVVKPMFILSPPLGKFSESFGFGGYCAQSPRSRSHDKQVRASFKWMHGPRTKA